MNLKKDLSFWDLLIVVSFMIFLIRAITVEHHLTPDEAGYLNNAMELFSKWRVDYAKGRLLLPFIYAIIFSFIPFEEYIVRIPMIIFYLSLAITLYKISETIYGKRAAYLTLTITLLSGFSYRMSTFVLTDIPMVLFMFLTFYFFLKYMKSRDVYSLMLSVLSAIISILFKSLGALSIIYCFLFLLVYGSKNKKIMNLGTLIKIISSVSIIFLILLMLDPYTSIMRVISDYIKVYISILLDFDRIIQSISYKLIVSIDTLINIILSFGEVPSYVIQKFCLFLMGTVSVIFAIKAKNVGNRFFLGWIAFYMILMLVGWDWLLFSDPRHYFAATCAIFILFSGSLVKLWDDYLSPNFDYILERIREIPKLPLLTILIVLQLIGLLTSNYHVFWFSTILGLMIEIPHFYRASRKKYRKVGYLLAFSISLIMLFYPTSHTLIFNVTTFNSVDVKDLTVVNLPSVDESYPDPSLSVWKTDYPFPYILKEDYNKSADLYVFFELIGQNVQRMNVMILRNESFTYRGILRLKGYSLLNHSRNLSISEYSKDIVTFSVNLFENRTFYFDIEAVDSKEHSLVFDIFDTNIKKALIGGRVLYLPVALNPDWVSIHIRISPEYSREYSIEFNVSGFEEVPEVFILKGEVLYYNSSKDQVYIYGRCIEGTSEIILFLKDPEKKPKVLINYQEEGYKSYLYKLPKSMVVILPLLDYGKINTSISYSDVLLFIFLDFILLTLSLDEYLTTMVILFFSILYSILIIQVNGIPSLASSFVFYSVISFIYPPFIVLREISTAYTLYKNDGKFKSRLKRIKMVNLRHLLRVLLSIFLIIGVSYVLALDTVAGYQTTYENRNKYDGAYLMGIYLDNVCEDGELIMISYDAGNIIRFYTHDKLEYIVIYKVEPVEVYYEALFRGVEYIALVDTHSIHIVSKFISSGYFSILRYYNSSETFEAVILSIA
ncbi:MAG: ArnT family glycosyltransferase [Candidatus Asgardarchaeia archaeon]